MQQPELIVTSKENHRAEAHCSACGMKFVVYSLERSLLDSLVVVFGDHVRRSRCPVTRQNEHRQKQAATGM